MRNAEPELIVLPAPVTGNGAGGAGPRRAGGKARAAGGGDHEPAVGEGDVGAVVGHVDAGACAGGHRLGALVNAMVPALSSSRMPLATLPVAEIAPEKVTAPVV